ncbi:MULTISPECIES: hypothetical protein [unclassified Flavobacterium]|jgi:hypothetical protein|uniref:hypothetical protein n=1 Tax=unclassified Flavobacterium TaxID=196869 RepID=UPI00070BD408|nr:MULTISPECIES: hypothetical protein [unclassified Flavobacterium]KRD61712.1 hypothetical protein ASE40_09310 [Flavobacterium sp. Root935]MDQ1166943.1 hypothetical protein [Flavobacterium sp. SORGH_AS_0622]TDX12410.1 hypothetical protein EDB96_1472 [Flavobacterium sp. S87F.05.LMB.W.Kidney.N]BDU27397.1 hypothetical protein FLGSB24_41410 [Flavobacterium sp. GSB-24]
MTVPEELYNIKFAEYFESMKVLYLTNDKFRTICDDYCSNVVNAQVYKKRFEKNFRRKLECENLSKELEEEILFFMIRSTDES